ncbi:MAG: YkgJ family cysteine cluster protein [Blastocatellia bacterium]
MPVREDAFLHYQKLLSDIEVITKSLKERFSQKITCHLGCVGCCQQQLTLSLIEADFISLTIRNLPTDQQQKILLAAQDIKNKTNKTDTCPLLDGFACSIYKSRPVICRTHGFPITFKDEESEEIFLDVCPLNFSEDGESVELNLTDTIDIDRLNLRLAAINYTYSSDKLGDGKKSAERMEMSEIIISALGDL